MNWVNLSCGWINMDLVARIDLTGDDNAKQRFLGMTADGSVRIYLTTADINHLMTLDRFPSAPPAAR